MKKISIILVVLFAACFSQLTAQVSVGVKTSYVKAWEEYGDVGLPDDAEIHVTGFNVSALAYFQFNKYISVGIEPGYIEKGAACIPGFVGFDQDEKLFLKYVEAPIMLRVTSPQIGNLLSIYGKFGGGTSRLVAAISQVEMLGDPNNIAREKIDLKNDERLNKWDYGLNGSIGAAINFGINQIFFETSMSHSLVDVDRTVRSENRTLQIGLGYMMTL